MELPKKASSPLRKGDSVVLVSTRPSHWNREGDMDEYLGKTMVISNINRNNMYLVGASSWGFRPEDIASILPREDGTIPTMPETYKKGDLLILTKNPHTISNNIGVTDGMRPYLGTIVEYAADGGSYFVINDDQGGYMYAYEWIERRATPEDIVAYREKKKKEQKELEEKMGKLCLTASKVVDIANEIFGAEFVMGEQIDAKTFQITVHFPEINILNSHRKNNNPHKIRDIFARFYVTNINPKNTGNKCTVRFFGSRTTWTVKELLNSYSHSHMSGNGFPTNSLSSGWSEFCVGYSEYKTLLDNCARDADPDNWYLLLYGLKNYLSWESLEGGPYRRIDNMNSNSGIGSRLLNNNELTLEMNRILPLIPKELWEYTIEGFSINPSSRKVVDFFNTTSRYKTMQVSSGDLSSYRARNGQSHFKFNDKQIPYKVFEEGQETTPIKDQRIEPAIVGWYCTQLTIKIRNFNKTYSYELLKRDNQSVFTHHRMEQRTKANHKPEFAKADQPLT